jgi:hypothetical protein
VYAWSRRLQPFYHLALEELDLHENRDRRRGVQTCPSDVGKEGFF